MNTASNQQRPGHVRYALTVGLLLLSAVAFLDRTNVSIAGVRIMQDFAFDNVHFGWVLSAFLLGYAAFQVPAGVLAKKFGPRRVLAGGLLWWGLFSIATAAVPEGTRHALLLLITVRFALGAGEAVMYPACSQFVERWFPSAERGAANGLIFAGVGLGSTLTPPLVTWVMLHNGWRASFWFSAALGLLAAALWYRFARDTPESHPAVRPAELEHIRAGRPEAAAVEPRTIPWARILLDRSVLALTFSYFAFGYVAWIFFGWFFLYLVKGRGLSLGSSGRYTTLPFLGMTLGCLLGGMLTDLLVRWLGAYKGRCVLGAASMLTAAALMLAGSRADSAALASITLAVGAGVLYIASSCFWAVAADVGAHFAAVVSGTMNMGAQMGGACTTIVTPLLAAHFGWKISFVAAAGMATLGAAAWLAVNPATRIASARPGFNS